MEVYNAFELCAMDDYFVSMCSYFKWLCRFNKTTPTWLKISNVSLFIIIYYCAENKDFA